MHGTRRISVDKELRMHKGVLMYAPAGWMMMLGMIMVLHKLQCLF